MEKEQIISLWQEKMQGSITDADDQLLTLELSKDQELAKELTALEQTWELFEEIDRPEPSAQMDARFDGMMAAYTENSAAKRTSLLDLIFAHLSRSWQTGLAALVVGLFIGWWMLPTQNQQEDINTLSSEIQSMKEMMMLTLIEQPKAQERIRAVNLAAELPDADETVIEALVTTLNHDENVNVRLASLESLTRYLDRPEVRHALVDALKMQDSALVLVAIADILVQIQEKSSLEAMEKLRESVKDDLVKEKLEQSILSLRQS